MNMLYPAFSTPAPSRSFNKEESVFGHRIILQLRKLERAESWRVPALADGVHIFLRKQGQCISIPKNNQVICTLHKIYIKVKANSRESDS
jgi:hypothetical protein